MSVPGASPPEALAVSALTRLPLDELLVARRLLEGGEARRSLPPPRARAHHARGRGDPGRAPEEAAQEEGANPLAALVGHGSIVGCPG